MKKKCKIAIPHGCRPELHELEVAQILAQHFACCIEFLRPSNSYKVSTPDIEMLGRLWEIKSPTSSSKYTISAQFKKASKQSHNIIIDGRRTKRADLDLLSDIHKERKQHKLKRHILFITKTEEVIDIVK